MFKLETLPKLVAKKRKRLGMGEGSGLGKNAGKGHKGQTKHGGKRPLYFTGDGGDAGQSKLSRAPKRKGFKALEKRQSVTIYIDRIAETLKAGETLNLETLKAHKLIDDKVKTVKVIKGIKADKIANKVKFDESENIYLSKGVRELIA